MRELRWVARVAKLTVTSRKVKVKARAGITFYRNIIGAQIIRGDLRCLPRFKLLF